MSKQKDDKRVAKLDKTAKDKEREKDDFDRWLAYMFTKMNTADYVPEWVHKKLREVYRFDRDNSFIHQVKKMRRLKKGTFIDPVNYICTVLTARNVKTGITANYGFIYSTDFKYYNRYSMHKAAKNPVFFSYCIAPSLLSADGEYRNRLLKFEQFAFISETYAREIESLEKNMAHKIERYELSLECENFFPQIEHEALAEQLDYYLVQYAVQAKFFALFWLVEIHSLSINMQENHQNPKFNQIFFTHLEEDLREFKELVKKFGQKRIDEMVEYCTTPVFRRNIDGAIYTVQHSVGQKLRPLNVGEVQEPLNLLFSPWLEIYLARLTSDLLANAICPSFAIFVDWFYIKNSRKGLFDNEQQYQKLEYSERALAITKKLRETQRITYLRDPKTDERKPLNAMFQILYDKIDDPIEYSKANLLMSNVTLGFVSEDVGRTFADIPILAKSAKWTARVGDILKTDWVFRKYVFDVQYALVSKNIHLETTHSDLHLNNCTINDRVGGDVDPEARVLYCIRGTWYALRARGPYACLIDFSRGTIHPKRVEKYAHWPDRSSYDEFVTLQNHRMINKLEQTVPTFMKINKDKIVELQRTQFDKFYRIYTAVDGYDFATRMSKAFGKLVSKASIALVDRIAKICEHHLTNIMLKLVNNPDLDVEWPMLTVIFECFTDDIVDINAVQKWPVIDMWLFDRATADKTDATTSALPYSLERFDSWPPMLKKEYGLPLAKDGEADISARYPIESTAYMDGLRLDYEKYRKEQMRMIDYIAQRHQEKYA